MKTTKTSARRRGGIWPFGRRHRVVRMLPEDAERLVTTSELKALRDA